ncbi:MAG: sigma-70 family RNA polymerase sigma factor [Woeseiaceae bacterium]|nr:sigma-70 family RNA polymerase sigma factor [Woeseiaceae bacterium]
MKKHLESIACSDDEDHLALLERIADGDMAALTRLYLQYHARLFKFVFRLTRSYSIADELVNDIMLIVWDRAGSFRGDSKVSTWIFGIAYRQAMRRVTAKRLQSLPLSELNEPAHDDSGKSEVEDWVEQGLYELPAAQRLTVILVFYLGLTYEETALVTECPVNTVKTRMFHARRKLKELLSASAKPEKTAEARDD